MNTHAGSTMYSWEEVSFGRGRGASGSGRPWPVVWLLAAAFLLGLGACGELDRVDAEPVDPATLDCFNPAPDEMVTCGGVQFADDFMGARLFVHPARFTARPYQDTDTASPAPAEDAFDGRNNTGTFSPDHPASWFCQQLVDIGHGDWYLPATFELEALLNAPGSATRITPGQAYWASTQYAPDPTRAEGMLATTPATGFDDLKASASPMPAVRCIRREG